MTTPEFTSNRDNYCYRHKDRQSFVLCQRCLRTVCPECQTQAAVGIICPECMKDERKNRTPAQRKAERRWSPRSLVAVQGGRPTVTLTILAITVFVGLLQLIPGLNLKQWLLYATPYVYPASGYPLEPWRLVTSLLVHGGILHLGLNMLSLWLIGSALEPMLGRWRFLAVYVIGGIGGNVVMSLISPQSATVGASGAIFAMFGVLLIFGLHLGQNVAGLLVILGINLVYGFLPGTGIAWEAHVGGMATGALLGLVLVRTKQRSRRVLQIALMTAVVALLVVLLVVAVPARILLLV